MPTPSLILASASPRRVELLRAAGFDFITDPADLDESDVPAGLTPDAVAMYLARAKAMRVAERHDATCLVLGADTVVAVASDLYGKAETPEEAAQMLRRLGDQRQRVITGISLVQNRSPITVEAVVSEVEMRAMTDAELASYIASDDWRGKAGAYGIQDHDPANDPFVRLVSGDFANVVGLPIGRVTELLRAAGVRQTEAQA